ncbi:MAG: TatD family hydrolase [Alphaproteobacteria bacterium]|jgi:TatD DNase family protein|nr:TatD family hydrolase [Alphaproteobacteria bacterium]
MLVDSHCHLDFPDLSDELDAVVARAEAAGVGQMLTISTKLTCFDAVYAIAERFANVYCSVGIHPHEAAAEPEVEATHLVRMAAPEKVVGIGETGLDFYYEHSPRETQERQFRAHIAAARESGLPLIVHSREADGAMTQILKEEMKEGAYTGVMHCFSSGPELAAAALDLGLYLSLSGILTFKSAVELREIAAGAPMDRLLIETDAPYLAPVPMRGKRNEPAFVAHTAACLARVKGLSVAEVADATTANFNRLFMKIPQPFRKIAN